MAPGKKMEPQESWFTEEDVKYYAGFLSGPSVESQRNFRTLMATVSEVLGETDFDALLKKLVKHAIQSTRSERGVLLLRQGNRLKVRIALDDHDRDLGSNPPIARSVPERVLREGKPVIAQVSSSHEVLDLSLSSMSLRLRQLMCAPLRARGKAIGAIYVDSTLSGPARTESDLMLFHAQAGLMGLAIENHRLFREAWEARDVQRQLATAREIQQRLYPPSPQKFGATELAGLSEISAQVGGDYFDYLPIDLHRMGLGVGDVSGHGIAPALMMSDLRGHLRSLLVARSGKLEGVYGALNQALCNELAEGMYVALFMAVYDEKKHELQFHNAGHSPPILYSPETDEFREIEANAPALGLFEDFSAGPCPTIPVLEGDCLVCYTDGVIDRPDPAGELYGIDRLKRAIRGAVQGGVDAPGVAEAIKADSAAHADGRVLRDDFTVLVARLG